MCHRTRSPHVQAAVVVHCEDGVGERTPRNAWKRCHEHPVALRTLAHEHTASLIFNASLSATSRRPTPTSDAHASTGQRCGVRAWHVSKNKVQFESLLACLRKSGRRRRSAQSLQLRVLQTIPGTAHVNNSVKRLVKHIGVRTPPTLRTRKRVTRTDIWLRRETRTTKDCHAPCAKSAPTVLSQCTAEMNHAFRHFVADGQGRGTHLELATSHLEMSIVAQGLAQLSRRRRGDRDNTLPKTGGLQREMIHVDPQRAVRTCGYKRIAL